MAHATVFHVYQDATLGGELISCPDMSLRPHRAITAVRLLLRAFFRRIEVSGSENVPKTGGGIVIAWHPNGLVDPALILASFPRRIVFGARHGLFRVPGLGALMRSLGTVPIYRAEDNPVSNPRGSTGSQPTKPGGTGPHNRARLLLGTLS